MPWHDVLQSQPMPPSTLVGPSHMTGQLLSESPPPLAVELLDESNNRGNEVKKRDDTHRRAEANRAFSH